VSACVCTVFLKKENSEDHQLSNAYMMDAKNPNIWRIMSVHMEIYPTDSKQHECIHKINMKINGRETLL
jgi:hypothetical protein